MSAGMPPHDTQPALPATEFSRIVHMRPEYENLVEKGARLAAQEPENAVVNRW